MCLFVKHPGCSTFNAKWEAARINHHYGGSVVMPTRERWRLGPRRWQWMRRREIWKCVFRRRPVGHYAGICNERIEGIKGDFHLLGWSTWWIVILLLKWTRWEDIGAGRKGGSERALWGLLSVRFRIKRSFLVNLRRWNLGKRMRVVDINLGEINFYLLLKTWSWIDKTIKIWRGCLWSEGPRIRAWERKRKENIQSQQPVKPGENQESVESKGQEQKMF